MTKYLKTLLFKPREIYTSRNMSWKNFWLFVIFLTAIRLTMIFVALFPAFKQFNQDTQDIANSLPAFEIEESILISEGENYIYQTDSLIFYFDPDGTLTDKDIEKNARYFNTIVSLALMPDGLDIYTIVGHQKIPYTYMPEFNHEILYQFLNNIGKVALPFVLLTFSFSFIFLLITYLGQLLIFTLLAFLVARWMGIPLSFRQTFCISMMASILPIFILTMLQSFGLVIPWQNAVQTISIFIFYIMTLREMKRRMD